MYSKCRIHVIYPTGGVDLVGENANGLCEAVLRFENFVCQNDVESLATL